MAFHSVAAGSEQRLFCDSDSLWPALALWQRPQPAPGPHHLLTHTVCAQGCHETLRPFCHLQKVELRMPENWKRTDAKMLHCFIHNGFFSIAAYTFFIPVSYNYHITVNSEDTLPEIIMWLQ